MKEELRCDGLGVEKKNTHGVAAIVILFLELEEPCGKGIAPGILDFLSRRIFILRDLPEQREKANVQSDELRLATLEYLEISICHNSQADRI